MWVSKRPSPNSPEIPSGKCGKQKSDSLEPCLPHLEWVWKCGIWPQFLANGHWIFNIHLFVGPIFKQKPNDGNGEGIPKHDSRSSDNGGGGTYWIILVPIVFAPKERLPCWGIFDPTIDFFTDPSPDPSALAIQIRTGLRTPTWGRPRGAWMFGEGQSSGEAAFPLWKQHVFRGLIAPIFKHPAVLLRGEAVFQVEWQYPTNIPLISHSTPLNLIQSH